MWILLPLLRPLLEAVEEPVHGRQFDATRSWTVSICVNLLLSWVTVIGMANSLLMVLVNFASPDRTALGAVNGISTAVGVSGIVVHR